MCIEASVVRPGSVEVDGMVDCDDYKTIAELAAVMPAGLVFADYFESPRTHDAIMAEPDSRLCPLDFEETARRNGCTVERDDSCMYMIFTPITLPCMTPAESEIIGALTDYRDRLRAERGG